jgi:hypothetical protein
MTAAQRRATQAVVVLLAIGLACRAIATLIAAAAAPEDALAWQPADKPALLALVAAADNDAARAAARQRVRAALALRPADGSLLRLLGQLGDADPALTERRYADAVRLRPADEEARSWLAGAAVQRGDYAAAAAHVDALLRVAPQRAAEAFPLLLGWLDQDAGAAALAGLWTTQAPWRHSFAGYVARAGAQAALYRFAQMLQSLRRGAVPPDLDDVRDLVNRLVRDGDAARAYLLWRSLLPAGSAGNMLHNGDFADPPSGIAFDWTLRSTVGANVAIAADEDHPHALLVRFMGGRVAEIGVAQTLLLAPGRYRLHGQARLDDLDGARGIQWRLTCLGTAPRTVATAPVPSGTQPWRAFALDLDVPADDCPAQRLELATRARVPVEQEMDGAVWFAGMRLEAL